MAKDTKILKNQQPLDLENYDVDQIDDFIDENKKNAKKKKRLPVVLIVLVTVILASTLVVAFNFMGVREKFVFPLLRNIPIIKNIIPVTDNLTETEFSIDELKLKNAELESQVDGLIKLNEEYTKSLSDRNVEIARLKGFADQQIEFKEDKENFDMMIANEDIKSYLEFYEKIYSENADKIYRDAIIISNQSKEMKKYVSTFSSMDEESASKILEELLISDIDLVINIMKTLDSEQAAAILGTMETKNAAVIARRMEPVE